MKIKYWVEGLLKDINNIGRNVIFIFGFILLFRLVYVVVRDGLMFFLLVMIYVKRFIFLLFLFFIVSGNSIIFCCEMILYFSSYFID